MAMLVLKQSGANKVKGGSCIPQTAMLRNSISQRIVAGAAEHDNKISPLLTAVAGALSACNAFRPTRLTRWPGAIERPAQRCPVWVFRDPTRTLGLFAARARAAPNDPKLASSLARDAAEGTPLNLCCMAQWLVSYRG
jgi:hypothetical protein